MDDVLYGQFAEVGGANWWFEGRRQVVEAVLEEALGTAPADPPRSILDVGCGTGPMLGMLGRFGRVEGLELSPDAIDHCHATYGDAVVVHRGRVPDDLPADGTYDVVAAFDVIEHLADDAAALRRIHDTVRPGGLFVSTVPAFPSLWGQQDVLSHHYRRYRRGGYRRLLEEAGFEVDRATYFNTWLFPPVAAVRTFSRLKGDGRHAPGSDFDLSPPAVDRVLTRVFGSERRLVRRHDLPFGVSLLTLARRPATPSS